MKGGGARRRVHRETIKWWMEQGVHETVKWDKRIRGRDGRVWTGGRVAEWDMEIVTEDEAEVKWNKEVGQEGKRGGI